jgi:16S rRNA (uracil1498-N3)-methyltransferase
MPIYFISSEQVDHQKIEIDRELAHHLQDVLRVKVGETLLLVDEQPKRYHARVIESLPGRLLLRIEGEERSVQKRAMVRLGIGLLKGEKMDWVLQKATELGAAVISPLVTRRVIAKPKSDRLSHQHDRWSKILTEAAQQSGRWEIPRLDPPGDLESFLAGTNPGFKLIFYEAAPTDRLQRKIKEAIDPFSSLSPVQGTLLIGPEGGWEKSEVDQAIEKGYSLLSLGERTLRAETAALAALSIVQYEIEGREGEKQDGHH